MTDHPPDVPVAAEVRAAIVALEAAADVLGRMPNVDPHIPIELLALAEDVRASRSERPDMLVTRPPEDARKLCIQLSAAGINGPRSVLRDLEWIEQNAPDDVVDYHDWLLAVNDPRSRWLDEQRGKWEVHDDTLGFLEWRVREQREMSLPQIARRAWSEVVFFARTRGAVVDHDDWLREELPQLELQRELNHVRHPRIQPDLMELLKARTADDDFPDYEGASQRLMRELEQISAYLEAANAPDATQRVMDVARQFDTDPPPGWMWKMLGDGKMQDMGSGEIKDMFSDLDGES